jgi:NTE family protein
MKSINLALQGGGAHGAYTWGVLDRLLEQPDLRIEAISGTSAGAMNAALLAAGHAAGGPEQARACLAAFWRGVSEMDRLSPIQRTPWDYLSGNFRIDHTPGFHVLQALVRAFSPYQLNPWNYNPLRTLLDRLVDFKALREIDGIKLFIAATNVRTGKARIFRNEHLSTDALLASGCLPEFFQAVEVEGEHFWDGGYMGNPSIHPLIYHCSTPDVLLVQIIPLNRPDVPRSALDIMNRLNEIGFNSSIIAEMRAIHFVTRLIDEGTLKDSRYKRMLMHMIEAEDELAPLGVSSKLNADIHFLETLRDIGYNAADAWLARHFDDIGKRSTVDLGETFL